MKKIFSLAIALTAFVGVANAQEEVMDIISGEFTETYKIDDVKEVTYKKLEWESLGMAAYTDDCFTTFYYVDPVTYDVEIQECKTEPGLYRLVNPYGEAFPYNDPGDWDTSKNYYFVINACDPDGVYCDRFDTGCDWGYGDWLLWSLAGYWMENGYTLEEEKLWGDTGTLKDGVITFPVEGLLISSTDYFAGSWYYANENGEFKIVLPSARSDAGAQKSKSVNHESITKQLNPNLNSLETLPASKSGKGLSIAKEKVAGEAKPVR